MRSGASRKAAPSPPSHCFAVWLLPSTTTFASPRATTSARSDSRPTLPDRDPDLGGSRRRLPEDTQRDCAKVRAERQGLPARVENDADKKVVAQTRREMAQPAEVLCPDRGSRLDLDGDHLPATVLQNYVDFHIVLCVVVVHLGALLGPGKLPRDLHRCESLQERAERALGSAEIGRIQTEQIRGDAGIHHRDLRRSDRPCAEIPRPCWKSLDQEDLLEQGQVALDRRLRQAQFASQRTRDQKLTRAGRNEPDQRAHLRPALDLRQLDDVTIDDVGNIGVKEALAPRARACHRNGESAAYNTVNVAGSRLLGIVPQLRAECESGIDEAVRLVVDLPLRQWP